jgi:hypothetical protein
MTDMPPLPEPAAHMYPSDLERFQTNETFATAYSVAVGNPDERSVPLLTLSDCVAYAAAEVAREREECAELCDRFAARNMHPAECAAAIRNQAKS